jgi:hypothetical protein
MLVPQKRRPQEKFNIITVRMDELTLVAEKHFGGDTQGMMHRSRNRHPLRRNIKRRPAVLEDNENGVDGNDTMFADPQPEEKAQHSLEHPRGLPRSEKSNLQIPRTPKVPLKRKQSLNRKVTFSEEVDVHQLSTMDTTQTETRDLSRCNGHRKSEGSQQTNRTAPEMQSPKLPKWDELSVLQQLSMVSVQRRIDSSDSDDSDDSDDNEFCTDEEESSDEASEGEEEKQDGVDILPDVDSGEDDDAKLEDNMDHRETGLKMEKEIPDSMDAEIDKTLRCMHDERQPSSGNDYRNWKNQQLERSGSIRYQHNPNIPRTATRKTSLLVDAETPATCAVERPPQHTPQRVYQERQISTENQQAKDSWRPRKPRTSNIAMEVDDEIVDSPEIPTPSNKTLRRGSYARRLSSSASQALTLVKSRPTTPEGELQPSLSYDSQGSIELGDPERLFRGSPEPCIPETQMEEEPEESVMKHHPSLRYFSRASQQLEEPTQRFNLVRLKSMPVSMHIRQDEQNELLACGIKRSEAFRHTVSPGGSMLQFLTVSKSTPRQEKSLQVLTRQVSIGLGTIPSSSVRRRMVSLPFNPPFKRQ